MAASAEFQVVSTENRIYLRGGIELPSVQVRTMFV